MASVGTNLSDCRLSSAACKCSEGSRGEGSPEYLIQGQHHGVVCYRHVHGGRVLKDDGLPHAGLNLNSGSLCSSHDPRLSPGLPDAEAVLLPHSSDSSPRPLLASLLPDALKQMGDISP